MFGGYRTGRHLWTLNDQPFLVQTPIGPNPGQYDTLDLQHEVNPGFVIGAAGTYFPRPNLGFEGEIAFLGMGDRKSTRLNSSHGYISYAVFCLKKKKQH